MTNMPFCYNHTIFLNFKNKNKQDQFIIFTSECQLNLISKCSQILIDGTFKSCPKSFYQLTNIAGYYSDMNSIIPLILVPTTGRSEYLYDKIIKNIISIYEDTGHKIKDFPKFFMMDFESAMQKAVKKNFENIKIDGCYFHFIKLFWAKAKKLNL